MGNERLVGLVGELGVVDYSASRVVERLLEGLGLSAQANQATLNDDDAE